MTDTQNKQARRSFAGSDPGLRTKLPDALRDQAPVRPHFDHARHPLISAQLKAMQKTEAQRRKESAGRNSEMIRLHRPFPDLRPKHEQGPLRARFNQAWLREQREARLHQYEIERAAQAQESPSLAVPQQTPTFGPER